MSSPYVAESHRAQRVAGWLLIATAIPALIYPIALGLALLLFPPSEPQPPAGVHPTDPTRLVLVLVAAIVVLGVGPYSILIIALSVTSGVAVLKQRSDQLWPRALGYVAAVVGGLGYLVAGFFALIPAVFFQPGELALIPVRVLVVSLAIAAPVVAGWAWVQLTRFEPELAGVDREPEPVPA